jgi:ABC-type transport system involved in cytochrome bd biosynthesis fused ATPase/permease subunit
MLLRKHFKLALFPYINFNSTVHACSSRTFKFITNKKFSTRGQENDVIISSKNVCFSYISSKMVLNDVNFTIRKGNKVTIMGQNGCGKVILHHIC